MKNLNCPDSHGMMQRIPGHWAFAGVDRIAGGLLSQEAIFRPNEKGCVVKLYSCPTCGLIRAYEDDSGD